MRFEVRPRIKRAFRLALRRADLTDAEVEEEIRFHVESRVDQLIASGLTREDAVREARRRFGLSWDDAVARVHEAGLEREERLAMSERLDAIWRDLAYALRTLRRQPAFATVVVLTFALGIGANATMFGVIDRLLLRPPPHVGHAGQLYEISHHARFGGGPEALMVTVPYPLYEAMRVDTAAFARVGASSFVAQLSLGSGASAVQVDATFSASDYFTTLETTPALGRFFTPAETDAASSDALAILSYGFWQRQFGGDRAVVGKTVRIAARTFTVIGVAPEGFTGVDPGRVDLWLPLPSASALGMVSPQWTTQWRSNWVRLLVRLRPGVTLAEAAERAGRTYSTGVEASGRKSRTKDVSRFEVRSILPSAQLAQNPEARVARLLLAVATVVLLIACANVAGLLLARGTERRREIAVRLALGVSHGRLVRLLVAETVVLAVCGGIVALAVAHWGLALLHATLLSSYAWTESAFDARVLGATVTLIVITTALAGLAPAWRSSQPDVVGSLKAGGRAGSRSLSRTRAALMVVQAALSVVLIVGAGLFVQSLRRAAQVELGYERDRVIAATMDVAPLGYAVPARVALYAAMRDRVAALPGVSSATLAMTHPLQGWGFGTRVRVPGRDSLPESPAGGPYQNAVGVEYFATLGLRIVEGRAFEPSDIATGARVTVVSEAMARAYWPGERAVDRCLLIGADSACTIVVGVAADAGEDVKAGDPRFLLYRPLTPQSVTNPNAIVVRAAAGADPRRLVEPIRRAMQTTEANLPYADVQLMDDLFAPQIRPWRLGAILFSLFGALALLIASVGLYSAISYGVTQRRHELGVRMALGARAEDVVRLVMLQGVRAAVGGVVLGSIAAVLAGRFVADLLFETSTRNPAVFGGVATLMLVVAVMAAFVPAWRASRVDPVAALRAD